MSCHGHCTHEEARPPTLTGSMQGQDLETPLPPASHLVVGSLADIRAGRGSGGPFPLPLTMAQGEHLFRKLWPLFPPSFLPLGPSCLYPSHCLVQPHPCQVLPLGNSLSAGRGLNWVSPLPRKEEGMEYLRRLALVPCALCLLPRLWGESSRRVSKVRVRQSLSPQLAQSWEGPCPAVSMPPLIPTSPPPITHQLLADAGVPGRWL